MKLSGLLALTFVFCGEAFCGEVFAADHYLVGAASQTITPPPSSFLAGYDRDRRASGQHDDLFVKAVVISDAASALAIVTIDCIGLTRPDIVKIQNQAALQVAGLSAERIIVTSTHTHAGPDVVGLWGEYLWSSGRDHAYMTALIDTAVAVVVAAAARKAPGVSRLISRQAPVDWVENVSEPELLDPTLAVLQFIDLAGNNIATLTNFACHPTVLGPDNTKVSADYVAGFYDRMGELWSGEHLFLQGAIGGWVQPVQGNRSEAVAVQYGTVLADLVIESLADAPTNPFANLQFAYRDFDVTLDNWGFRLMIWLGVLERELHDGAMRTRTAWFTVGNAAFVTHPGETSPAYSLASRVLMQRENTFVLGLAQDAMGYILKPEYFADDAPYAHADYLRSVSVGASAGPMLMQTLTEIVVPVPHP